MVDTPDSMIKQYSLKHQWRKDTACEVCTCPFGVVGLVYYKKYHCKVCFHGICAKCSTYVDSLDPRKTETVCVKCAGSGVTNTKNKQVGLKQVLKDTINATVIR